MPEQIVIEVEPEGGVEPFVEEFVELLKDRLPSKVEPDGCLVTVTPKGETPGASTIVEETVAQVRLHFALDPLALGLEHIKVTVKAAQEGE